MIDEKRAAESQRLLALLESARAEYGREAMRRLEQPILALAGLAPMAETGDDLRYPDGLFIPELKSAPWLPHDFVPDVALLEAAYPAMRAELDLLLQSRRGFQPFDEGGDGFYPGNVSGAWNVFYVVLGGREAPGATAWCPNTLAALRTLPNLGTSAMFSALTPGTHLEAHSGPTNAVISLSMGLIIPAGCVIRVGTEERSWREGECLVFDDTYEHEVWQRGDATRFVMLLEAWHPELTPAERKVVERVVWAPGDVEAQLEKRRTMLDGQEWWV